VEQGGIEMAPGEAEDRGAFDRLVVQHLPAALMFAQRLTGNLDSAEEVLQEALHHAARGWRTYRGEAQFRTWLWAIILNAFRDRLSERPAHRPLPDEVCDPRQAEPPSEAAAHELGRMVAELVSALPPRQREVLVMIGFEGLSVSEVASMLSISEANVHSTLHVARSRLRKHLAPYLAEK